MYVVSNLSIPLPSFITILGTFDNVSNNESERIYSYVLANESNISLESSKLTDLL